MTSTDRAPGIGLGLALALVGFVAAALVHEAIPAVPILTACVVLGLLFTLIPWRPAVTTAVAPGIAVASRRLLRIGVVLLGFKLSIADIAGLGWVVLALIVGVVVLTFAFTWFVGRAFGLPGHQPLLIAAGFSICGASAIGAMSGVTRSKPDEAATPIALVTLCGTLAIAVLPALQHPLGLDALQFGSWTGASVHDVGQVVATAQIAGASALAIAVVVKLTRVALLAPMVAITGAVLRRSGEAGGDRPAIMPLFVAGFIAAVAVRSLLPLSDEFLAAADAVQLVALGMALFGLGSAIRLGSLVRTGGRALAVAAISWLTIAALAFGAVMVAAG